MESLTFDIKELMLYNTALRPSKKKPNEEEVQ
jgi:hypothetical protein